LRVVLRRYGWIAVVSLAAAVGILSITAAREHPTGSFAGMSTLAGIAELGAGWSLVVAGLLFWGRHRDSRFGLLLVAAGFAWFLPEWSNPGFGSALGFTVGIIGFVACAPLVGHAALAYPTGRLRSRLEVAVVVASYAGALLLLGLLPATVFDTRATGCLECPSNLALVRGDSELFDAFSDYGLRVGIGWLLAVIALLLLRLVRSRTRLALLLPILAPAIAYLALVAWDIQHALARGILSTDSLDQGVWRAEAAALIAFAFAVGWVLLRERRAGASVARFLVELDRMPRPGAVRDALSHTLADPELELAYRRPGDGSYMDASGHSIDLDPGPGCTVTPLVRGETPVAALVHDIRLLDQPGLLQEVLAAARLAIENEQLQAEVQAQLEELRASRTRIVQTADAERRRLERDLHDGAQQLLLALSFDLQLARTTAETGGDSDVATLLASAGAQAQTALGELRDLAHGIYPAILAEAGLAPALATLADEAPLPVELGEVTPHRYAPPVETAAYRTVADAVDDASARGATFVAVRVSPDRGRLFVNVEDDGVARRSQLVTLVDRVGALGGSVEAGPTTLRAEIPCA
jgi:signal transduction histidine kinase